MLTYYIYLIFGVDGSEQSSLNGDTIAWPVDHLTAVHSFTISWYKLLVHNPSA